MPTPGPTKWLVLAVLAAGCAREGPPAPVFDRVLALVQPDRYPTSTVEMRDRVRDYESNQGARTSAYDAGSSNNQAAAPSAVPLPRVKVTEISPADDQNNASVQVGQPHGTQLASLPNEADQPVTDNDSAFHTVARGDTLYSISNRYGTDVTTLANLNGVRAPYTISLGQRLALPNANATSSPVVVAAAAPPAPPAPPAIAEDTATTRPASARPVLVDRPEPQIVQPATPAAPPPQLAEVANPRSKPAAPQRPTEVVNIGPPPPRAGSFAWPVEGKILVGYGPTSDGLHNDGLNIAAPLEAPVRAAENGVVAYAGNEIRGFGKLVLIKHDGGLITAYGHNKDLLVRRGDIVKKGQVIARVGASGGVTVPQLHFEIREGRQAVDPRKLLPAQKA